MDRLVQRTKVAMLKAVDQLVTDFRVHSLAFLPYEAHLVILTYIYANHPTLSASQLRRVRQWFWRTSFAERYRGASDAFITRDLENIQTFVLSGKDSEARQYGSAPDELTIKSMVFRKNNSRSRAFVLALAKHVPRNITNGNTIDTADALSIYNRKQFHHIFPEAFLKRKSPETERNLLLNFCMLAAAENNAVSDDDPNDYLPALVKQLGDQAGAVFMSNLLPKPDLMDYSTASLEDLVNARAKIVHEAIRALCAGSA